MHMPPGGFALFKAGEHIRKVVPHAAVFMKLHSHAALPRAADEHVTVARRSFEPSARNEHIRKPAKIAVCRRKQRLSFGRIAAIGAYAPDRRGILRIALTFGQAVKRIGAAVIFIRGARSRHVDIRRYAYDCSRQTHSAVAQP